MEVYWEGDLGDPEDKKENAAIPVGALSYDGGLQEALLMMHGGGSQHYPGVAGGAAARHHSGEHGHDRGSTPRRKLHIAQQLDGISQESVFDAINGWPAEKTIQTLVSEVLLDNRHGHTPVAECVHCPQVGVQVTSNFGKDMDLDVAQTINSRATTCTLSLKQRSQYSVHFSRGARLCHFRRRLIEGATSGLHDAGDK